MDTINFVLECVGIFGGPLNGPQGILVCNVCCGGTCYVCILNVFLLVSAVQEVLATSLPGVRAEATFEMCNTGVVRALVHGVYCVAGQRGHVRLLPP